MYQDQGIFRTSRPGVLNLFKHVANLINIGYMAHWLCNFSNATNVAGDTRNQRADSSTI